VTPTLSLNSPMTTLAFASVEEVKETEAVIVPILVTFRVTSTDPPLGTDT
jgi:hypothetical protein